MSSSPHVTKQHGQTPDDAAFSATTLAAAQHRYGGPEALTVERVPMPSPASDEVLVRVQATSVNARDWHVMRGEPRIARLMAPGNFRLRRPRVATRGTDLAGIVVAVGSDVTQWRPGDLVLGEGSDTFAEHAIAKAGQLAAIPDTVPLEKAAELPQAATTALECLEAAAPHAGQSLLINGASEASARSPSRSQAPSACT
jgi:NADPH:quinone reductase-like Zn-dependent oxidoreductase